MSTSKASADVNAREDRLDEIRRIARNYSKLSADSTFLGSAPSSQRGHGNDFGELRQYVYGEDARNIDWKSSVRSNSLLIRTYLEERERRVLVMCPVGPSIQGNTSMGESKTDVLSQLMGSIAYIARSYGDRFAFAFDTPGGFYRSEFRSGMAFLESNLSLFEQSCRQPSSPTPLEAMSSQILGDLGTRIVVFMLGDETDFIDGGIQGARNMRMAGCDVRALAVDDALLFERGAYDMDESGYLPHIPEKDLVLMRVQEWESHMVMRKHIYAEMDRNDVKFETVTMANSIPDALLPVLAGRRR